MVYFSIAIVLLCSTFSHGQAPKNTRVDINVTETGLGFGLDFNATLHLTCGPDTVISVFNVTTCPQGLVHCGQAIVSCPRLNKGDIQSMCGNKQYCSYNKVRRCGMSQHIQVTLEVWYTCLEANNETALPEVTPTPYTTSYTATSPTYTSTTNNNFTTTPTTTTPPTTTITTTSTTPTPTTTSTPTTTIIPAATTDTPTPTITVISAATATLTKDTSITASTSSNTGTTTRKYVVTTRGNSTYPHDTTESGNRDQAIIIALSVVSALSLIAFLAVTFYVCCIRRRCGYCNPFKKQGQDEQLPGIALSRPPSVLNPYETTPVGWAKGSSTRYEIKASEESDHIYSEVDLDGDLDLDGPSEVYTTNPKTDIDSGYNELYTDIDLPVTVINVAPEQEVIETTKKDSYYHIFLDKVFSFLNDFDGSENSNDGDEAVQASGNINFDDAKPEVDCTSDSKIDQEPGPKHKDTPPKSAGVKHEKTESSCSSNSNTVGQISAQSPGFADPTQNGYFTLESVDEGLSEKSRMPESDVSIVSKVSTDDDKPRRVSDPTKDGYFTLESVNDESNPKDSMLDTDIPIVSKCSPGEDGSNCDVVQSEQSTPGTRKQITTKPKDHNSIEDDDTEYNTLNLREKPMELKLIEDDTGTSGSDYNKLSLSDPRSDVKEKKLVQKTAEVTNTGYDTVRVQCTKETTIPATSDTIEGQYNKLNLCETNNASQPNGGNLKDNVLSSNGPKEDTEYNTLKLCETKTGKAEVVTGNLPLQNIPEQKVPCTDGTEGDFEYNKLNLSETVTGSAEVVNCSQPNPSMSKEKVTCDEEREEDSHYNKLNL